MVRSIRRTALSSEVDPITLEVIKGAIRSLREEMATVVERTAMSESIREKLDYFVAIFDRAGKLVYGTTLPLGANIIDCVLERYPADSMEPGDLYWYNDCYLSRGGVSHSPDIVFVVPVFYDGKLVAFSEAWGHVQDIGGLAPGSNSPLSTEIFHEGIIVPPSRLERGGIRNDELFRMALRNSRFPDTLKGDIRALIAAVRLGERRLHELCDRFGRATVESAFEGLIEQTEQTLRATLRERILDGEYDFEDWVDGDVYADRSYAIRLTLRKTGDDVTLDFTRSDDQARGTINFIMHESVPALMYGMYVMAEHPTFVLNDGCMRALPDVRVRDGSILRPRFPAPLGQRVAVWLRVNTAVFGALGKAVDGQVPASFPYFVVLQFRWQDPKTKQLGYFINPQPVGHGARPFADGHDGVYYVAQRDLPVEFTEIEHPFRVERYELHQDSGGPGRYRGGCGIVRDFRVLADEMLVRHTMDNVLYPPWGIAGGKHARPGRFVLNPGTPEERVLAPKGDNLRVRKGDVFRVVTCGGGGWGNPLERDSERVRADVRGGFVSVEGAERDYGVVLHGDGLQVDVDRTTALRRQEHLQASRS